MHGHYRGIARFNVRQFMGNVGSLKFEIPIVYLQEAFIEAVGPLNTHSLRHTTRVLRVTLLCLLVSRFQVLR